MGKIKSIFWGLPAILAFAACNGDEEEKTPVTENGSYVGTTSVTTLSSGDVFTQAGKTFTVTYNQDGTLEILMEEAKFAENMPMGFDMQLKNIPYTQDGGTVNLSASSVIPEIGDVPYERYEITALKGNIAGGKLVVDFTCMGLYTVNFTGSESYP